MVPQLDFGSAMKERSGSAVDMKLYVALESSGESSGSAFSRHQQQWPQYNNPGYNNNVNQSSRLEGMDSDVNNGRCPHHVKLGDSEWGNADRPASQQIRVPYQVGL